MIHAHKSLVENYIHDYIHLTHEIYPSFLSKLSVNYYSLNIPLSNFSEEFRNFYNDIDNDAHGGKYDIIYNLPVFLGTSSILSHNANEKGITINESTNINCNIDALINLIPKEGDLLAFTNIPNSEALYKIVNIELSSILRKPFTKLSLVLVPNLTTKKMENFIVTRKGFVTNYHYIFEKGEALMIIELQKKVDRFIEYFNEIYDSKIDAHIDNDHRVFLEFEKAFNEMLESYKQHTSLLRINRSHLHDNLLTYYSDNNPFRNMLDPSANRDNTEEILYTSSIKRLDKTRRRTINNRVKIYRLLNKENSADQKLIDANSTSIKTLEAINTDSWKNIIDNEDFMNDVKDQLTTFIENECKINPTDMFGNAIKLAQIFYIMEVKIGAITKNRLTNFVSHGTTVR